MGKKSKAIKASDNRIYPIKVRLVKPNQWKQDKIVCNGIELFTFKDVEIKSVNELMKIQSLGNNLIIKSKIKESKSEVIEEKVEDELSFDSL